MDLREIAQSHWITWLTPFEAEQRRDEFDRFGRKAVARLQRDVFSFRKWRQVSGWLGLEPDDPEKAIRALRGEEQGRRGLWTVFVPLALAAMSVAAWNVPGRADVVQDVRARLAALLNETGSFVAVEPQPVTALPDKGAAAKGAVDTGMLAPDGPQGLATDRPSEDAQSLQPGEGGPPEAEQTEIRRLQAAMRGFGTYAGPLDGTRTAETRRAMEVSCLELEMDCGSASEAKVAELTRLAMTVERETRARTAREEADWALALSGGTVEDYAGFLREHPVSSYADEALDRIDALLPGVTSSARAADPSASSLSAAAPVASSSISARDGAAFAGNPVPHVDARSSTRSVQAPLIDFDPAFLPDFALFRECVACPEMVVIPGGTFTMGSPPTDPGRWQDEGPQQRVRVERFAIGRFEVTEDDWQACASVGNCPSEHGVAGSNFPVSNINWDEAGRYAEHVSSVSGAGYRRVTEAEWEYAARAGETQAYVLSDQPSDLCGTANGADLAARALNETWVTLDCNDGFAEAAPAGSFRANSYGLFDMIGNVWEWTADCYRDSLANQDLNGQAHEEAFCFNRAHRGGSWVDSPRNLRVTVRDRSSSAKRSSHIGMRVARSLGAPPQLPDGKSG